MTSREAIDYISDYTWSKSRLGLSRTRELLNLLGNPQEKLKFVHVAGSNGKGSTCAILSSILRHAGYKTGLYTSPHIESFLERIQIDGQDIPEIRLAEITERVKNIADKMADHPSQFELITAIAMLYFCEENCDIVVLETGMGGELDSTNVIPAPEVAVITNIGLEHTEYLGKTLEQIAKTKAGIIKTGTECVCYDGDGEVTQIIKEVCANKGVPFNIAKFSEIKPLERSLRGQSFSFEGFIYELPLIGSHQLKNAALALTAVDALRRRGFQISQKAVFEGLKSAKWQARMEVLSQTPTFILDGGHNPQCAEALSSALKEYLNGEKVTFLIGVLEDKDISTIINSLHPYAKRFVCVTPNSPRALASQKLAEQIKKACDVPIEVADNFTDAVAACLKHDEPTVAFGSLYMVSDIRNAFNAANQK